MTRVRSSRPRNGVDPIRFPGERGFKALKNSRKNGLPLDEEKLRMIDTLAEKYGVDSPVT